MIARLRWGKALLAGGVAVVAILAALAAYVQIQQRILRWRAERLLADVRELQSHRGTWADAQELMTRWGLWGSYDGSCTKEQCDYSILLTSPLDTFVSDNIARYPSIPLPPRLYALLGEKSGYIEATLQIKQGLVTESRFQLYMGLLIGRETAVNEFEPYQFRSDRLLHPEYWIGVNGGCTGCIKFETEYTPLAGREKIRELTDFNFSCLTRLFSCKTEADIMPAAWRQYKEEGPGREARRQAFEQCTVPLEFFGRELENVVVVDVTSRLGSTSPDGSDNSSERLHVIRTLKGQMPWLQNKVLTASNAGNREEIHGWSTTTLAAGKQYILFGELEDNYSSGQKALVLDDCGAVPYTEQNLAAIQRGIQRQALSDAR